MNARTPQRRMLSLGAQRIPIDPPHETTPPPGQGVREGPRASDQGRSTRPPCAADSRNRGACANPPPMDTGKSQIGGLALDNSHNYDRLALAPCDSHYADFGSATRAELRLARRLPPTIDRLDRRPKFKTEPRKVSMLLEEFVMLISSFRRRGLILGLLLFPSLTLAAQLPRASRSQLRSRTRLVLRPSRHQPRH